MLRNKSHNTNETLLEENTVSLVIKAPKLDFTEIEKELNLKATRILLNGESVFEEFELNDEDAWVYELPIDTNLPLIKHLEEITNIIDLHKNYFQAVVIKYKLSIQCTYQLNLPIGIFAIPSHILNMFSIYNMNLEVMVVSHYSSKDVDIIEKEF